MVNAGFTRKKVESLTLGEKLKKLRGDFHMTLPEISKATRIQVKYLEFLENGAYEKLPADVYVRGFLRSYARYLNIDEQAFIKLYERERHIQKNLGHEAQKPSQAKLLSPTSLVISSRSLILGAIVLLVGGAFFYIYQEFKSFAATPRLVIMEPQSGTTIMANEVVLKGETDKGASVVINNQSVFVGSNGEFSEKLLLQPGINTVTVVATNRFDKEKSAVLSLEARYSVAETAAEKISTPEVQDSFRVTLSAHALPVDISVMADGVVIFNGTLSAQEQKVYVAKERISVSSNHGESTFVRFNEGEEEALTTKIGAAKGVVFIPSGRGE